MKKILIIAYYWPPAGGPGVQRWLKFVKYLPEFGYLPVVYIPENPTYPIIDDSFINDISDKAIIIRGKIFEPYKLASIFGKKKFTKISSGIIPAEKKQGTLDKIALWVRGNLFIPDARILWVRPSVNRLTKVIHDHEIQTVITTGPPHSLHLIGMKLKSRLKINWIADFRDPWTTIGYHQWLKLSLYAEQRHKSLEKKVLNAADKIIVTSNTTRIEFQKITTKSITVITNGYDVSVDKGVLLDEKFTISHIGSLLAGRNPKILWQALSELMKEEIGFAENFQLKLIGAVSEEIVEAITNYNLLANTELSGYLSHPEAIHHQQKTQVLLLIEVNSAETKSIVPGKLFEYLISGRPIISIGPQGSDFAEIISETNSGIFVSYSEKEKLKSTIAEYYAAYLKRELKPNTKGVEKYSRRNLTARLADLLPQ